MFEDESKDFSKDFNNDVNNMDLTDRRLIMGDEADAAPEPGSEQWREQWNSDWSRMSGEQTPTAAADETGGAEPIENAMPFAAEAPAEPAKESEENAGAKRKKKGRGSLFGKVAAAALAVVLGAGSLGLGLSFGGRFAEHMFASEAANDVSADDEAMRNFSFDKISGGEIPVNAVSDAPLSLSEVFNKSASSVVSINTTIAARNYFNQTYELPSAGSGIIFDIDDGKVYIATNNHVIEDAEQVSISLDDDTQVEANYIGSDPSSDLAVISVNKADLDAVGVAYTKAVFGDSDALRIGDTVMAVGNAMGEGKTATSGIVSALNKELAIGDKSFRMIQTDSAINPGNSGGALVNVDGEVVGINTAKISDKGVEGMGYSIPSNEAMLILKSLKETGIIEKPYLGIVGSNVTEAMMNSYNIPSKGVLVRETTDGSGAAAAGILPNDIIVEFNNVKIETIDELLDAIAATSVGDVVDVKALRNGNEPVDFRVEMFDANETPLF